MNRTKKLAKEQFGGNQLKAINFMLDTFSATLLDEYMSEFTIRQASMFFDLCICKATIAEIDSPNEEEQDCDYSWFLDPRNQNAPNPYEIPVKRALIRFFLILILSFICVNIPMIHEQMHIILMLTPVLPSILFSHAAGQIIAYFTHRKRKKIFEICIKSEIQKQNIP